MLPFYFKICRGFLPVSPSNLQRRVHYKSLHLGFRLKKTLQNLRAPQIMTLGLINHGFENH